MKVTSRAVGLHIRIFDTPISAVKKAMQSGMSCFQSFFSTENPKRRVVMSNADVAQFRKLYTQFEGVFYVHASYWVNLADGTQKKHPILLKEIALAKRLGCKHIILHSGTAKGVTNKNDALAVIASFLNFMMRKEPSITFILENTAHTGASIGGDLHDFAYIRSLLDNPDGVKFCIDTAHAYLFGYDITDDQARQDFIELLDQTVGIHNIVLFHLNDTQQLCGSKIDQHAIVGQGSIGLQALQKLVCSPLLNNIPIIMEMPSIPLEQEKEILELVKSW